MKHILALLVIGIITCQTASADEEVWLNVYNSDGTLLISSQKVTGNLTISFEAKGKKSVSWTNPDDKVTKVAFYGNFSFRIEPKAAEVIEASKNSASAARITETPPGTSLSFEP